MTDQRHHDLAIHHLQEGEGHELLRRQQIARRTRWIVIVVAVLLAVGAGRTVMSRMGNARVLEEAKGEKTANYVKVASPKKGGTQNLSLPGTLQGYVQAPIAARASGYVRKWNRDIGSQVKQGEVLAEIETPELDQQLAQGMAARNQAAASLALATSTRERWEALRQKDAVSQQELDERRGNEAQAKANLDAAEATMDRFRQLASFKRITAPFSGVIIRRNIDVGDLIDAGAARPLFVMAQIDTLRIYVNVPQSYAHLVKPGETVTVTQAELRGQSFKGQVARTAGAIDTATRTMQVEVTLANKEGLLVPGAFVQVQFPLAASDSMTIPTNAIMVRGEGVRVATVGAGGVIKLKPVRIGRNFGEAVELLEGVGPKEQLVLNPADSLADGDKVTIAPDAPPKGAAAKDGAKSDAKPEPAKEKS